MREMEIEAKSIDEAIEKACSEFQVPREKLNIEIISEGTPGFLGIGAKKAQIRASLLSIDMELEPAFTPREPEALPRVAPVPLPVVPPVVPMERKPEPPAAESRPPQTAATGTDDHLPLAEKAKGILEGILTRMEMASPVTVEETEDAILLNIQGDGSGLLIGKRGQNLDAIQYIVNKAAHHSATGQKMVIIDTEAYRKRREESLVALATRLGEKVKKTKKPVTVGHMNAHDRRVVHLAMQNDETLTTKSRGEGEYRKIVILPVRRGPDQADA